MLTQSGGPGASWHGLSVHAVFRLLPASRQVQAPPMFAVDEVTALAIRQACEDGGELSGVVELRRHFPLITDNTRARLCLQMIMSWAPITPAPEPAPHVELGASPPSRRRRAAARVRGKS